MSGSILETFYLLFESDASEVKKGAEEAEKATDKLDKKLKSTDYSSKKVGESFLGLARSAAGVIATALSVGAVLRGAFQVSDIADKLNKTSQSLGISVEELDTWGSAVKSAGGTAEGFISSVDNLSTAMTHLEATGKSRVAPFFKELGINMLDAEGKARPVMELLPEIAQAFEGLSKQESRALGKKLGLDEGTIMLLQRGRRETEALIEQQKEFGAITTEDAEIATKFKDQLESLQRVFRGLYISVASAVLPVLTKLLNSFESLMRWMRQNKNLVEGFFIFLGVAVASYTVAALRAAIATKGLTAALKLLAANKLVAIILAIAAAFAVLYDDYMAFRAGQGSIIGEIVKGWEGLKNRVIEIWETIKNAVFDSVNTVKGWFFDLGDAVIGVWETIKGYILDAVAAITGVINDALNLVGLGKKVTVEATQKREYTPAETEEALRIAQYYIGQSSTAPINSTTSPLLNSSSQNISTNNQISIGEVNIETQATDADGIARSISGGLNREMRQAVSNFDDGVAR